jgi:glycosyltransferase involved in cell wall biosynthesis
MTGKIRVAQVLETIHLGGVEQRVRTIVRGLDPDRYEHLVICTQALGDIPDQLRECGATVVEVGVFRSRIDLRAIRKAYRALRAFKPDIVHGGVFEGVIMGVLAGKMARVPVIISEETSDPAVRRRTGHFFAEALYHLSDVTIGVSPFIARYLTGTLKIPPPKVRMIANAVTSPQVSRSRAALAEFGIPPDSIVFGTLGRLLDAHKGTSDAIRAFADLSLKQRTDLLIVGIGPDEAMLRELSASLGVSDRIHFAGYRGDPYPLLSALDVFMHPARYEAFGMVVAEAMFAGLPVVATDVGGVPDVVAKDETALLVSPNDVPALSRAMARLAGDGQLRAKLGKAGLARANAQFSEARYLIEIDSLYREFLAR